MRPVALAGILLSFAAALVLATGCASSGTDLPTDQAPTDTGPPATLTAELPAPSSLKLTQGVLSHVYHTGDDYVGGWAHQRVWKTDESTGEYRPDVVFDPFWMVDVVRRAYAIYSFETTGFTHGCTVSVNWQTTGGDGECWIGMANFEDDAWRWHVLGPEGYVHFDPEACIADGAVYALVLLTGTTRRRLESIHLGFELPPLISSVSPLSGEQGTEITLSALLNIPEELVTTWYWDLNGAGSIGTSGAATPTLTLGSADTYECSVRAWNAWGETEYPFVLNVDQAGADWHHAVVARADDVYSPTSLALGHGSHKHPNIAFRDSSSPVSADIKHLRYLEGFWRTETAALGTDAMTNSSLAIDTAGIPHLAYTHSVSPDWDDHRYVIHAHRSGGAWQHDVVDGHVRPYDLYLNDGRFFKPALALAPDDQAGLCYVNRTYYYDMGMDLIPDGETLQYAGPPAAATLETVDPYAIREHALDIDAAGNPGVAYVLRDGDDRLRYDGATAGGPWSGEVETVDSFSRIALEVSDTDDQPRICYVCTVDPGPHGIHYARYDGSAWQISTVTGAGNVGDHISMALDSGGRPWICYHEATADELRCATPDGLGWEVMTVDDTFHAGQYCDIAVDTYDRAHISYFDETNGYIKYAWQPAG